MNSQGRTKGTTGQAQALTERDIEIIKRSIKGGDNPHQATRNMGIFILSNWLGLRSKELAALKVKDVYENGRVKDTLRLLAGYTKGEKHRDLALSNSEVIKAIRATVASQEEQYRRINPESPLFRSNRGSSFSANSMRRVLKTIYIDAGYPDASSHSGRRSMITRLAEKGIDVNSIRIIAGHSSLQTTQRYIEENPARLANILKGL
jgi:integrase/recombinase XerD